MTAGCAPTRRCYAPGLTHPEHIFDRHVRVDDANVGRRGLLCQRRARIDEEVVLELPTLSRVWGLSNRRPRNLTMSNKRPRQCSSSLRLWDHTSGRRLKLVCQRRIKLRVPPLSEPVSAGKQRRACWCCPRRSNLGRLETGAMQAWTWHSLISLPPRHLGGRAMFPPEWQFQRKAVGRR